MLKTMQKHGVTLALFAAFTTGLTAAINELTKHTIAEQAARVQQTLFDQVIPTNLYDNNLQQSCYLVKAQALGIGLRRIYVARKGEHPIGVVMEATAPDGYSGAIQLLVGSDFRGTIWGVRVIEHHETPGLGDKIDLRVSHWITTLSNKRIMGEHDKLWAVKEDGGQFDQFTGATITPRAVVNEVKRAGLYAQTLPPMLSSLPRCGDAK